jgi:hypothetical protein
MNSVEFGAVMAVIAGIVWLVRLEGRINLTDRLIVAMEKRMEGLEVRIISELRDLKSDIKSLSDKIDHKADKE